MINEFIRKKAPPYKANQNAIAVRANRTIAECARTILEHASLPFKFCAEAVVHSAKIRNHFLGPNEENSTSVQLITGMKPDVASFRIFCCLGWYHIPKELRKTLDPKSKLGIVIGCSANSQYKLWIPSWNVAVIVKHVTIVRTSSPLSFGMEISTMTLYRWEMIQHQLVYNLLLCKL